MNGRCEHVMDHGGFCGLTLPCAHHNRLVLQRYGDGSISAMLVHPITGSHHSIGHWLGSWQWEANVPGYVKARADELRYEGLEERLGA